VSSVSVDPVEELERAERQLLAALNRRDTDAAAALLRDDFLITTAGWIAEPVGKQAWLDSAEKRMTLDSFDLRLLATQRFGDVAVVLAESPQEGKHDGAPFSLTFRYTDVWVHDASGWALATRHASIVPQTTVG
jgi:ketosteroid isomerase-like protein